MRTIARSSLAVALLAGAALPAAAQTVVTNPGAPFAATALTGFTTTGADMVGMQVTAFFADGSTLGGTWGDLGAGTFGVDDGGFALTFTKPVDPAALGKKPVSVSSWTYQYLSN